MSKKVTNLISDSSISVYPASYGIGVVVLFGRTDNQIETVKKILDDYQIKYKTEYSQAHWVYRFKISKSKSNLDQLELINK